MGCLKVFFETAHCCLKMIWGAGCLRSTNSAPQTKPKGPEMKAKKRFTACTGRCRLYSCCFPAGAGGQKWNGMLARTARQRMSLRRDRLRGCWFGQYSHAEPRKHCATGGRNSPRNSIRRGSPNCGWCWEPGFAAARQRRQFAAECVDRAGRGASAGPSPARASR